MNRRAGRGWLRLGQAAALGGLAVLGLADFRFGVFKPASWRPDHLWFDLTQAFSAVVAATVWLRSHRYSPRRLSVFGSMVALVSLAVTALPLLGGPTGGFGTAEVAALLGLLVVLARGRRIIAGIGVGIAVAVQPLRDGYHGAPEVIASLSFALLAAGAATVGVYLRSVDNGRRQQVAAVQAEQRAQFARDLHDFIAHYVTGIVVQAQAAQVVAAYDPPGVVSALKEIERAGGEAMTSMRRVVSALRQMEPGSADTRHAANIANLNRLIDSFGAGGPAKARLYIDGRVDDLPVEIGSSAYRVVMEALTNVRRHAAGVTAVEVILRRGGDALVVEVRDNGRQGRPRERHGEGFGIRGLAERVGALGGRLRAGPAERGGWRVEAVLPLGQP